MAPPAPSVATTGESCMPVKSQTATPGAAHWIPPVDEIRCARMSAWLVGYWLKSTHATTAPPAPSATIEGSVPANEFDNATPLAGHCTLPVDEILCAKTFS